MLKQYLEKLLDRRDLTASEIADMLEKLAGGQVPAAQAGAVLAALHMKGECVAELAGGAALLRRKARFIDCGNRECVDIVGTGGDGGISFNISTTAALVASGAGVCIAKHGNRAVSGKSGAADLLAELGFNLNAAPECIEECIAEHGIGFMFAPKLHPLMGQVAELRRDLGFRSIFNLLGPLANPAGAARIVAGVFSAAMVELYAAALGELGAKHAMVVHGRDGLDEISCCAPTRVSELRDGSIYNYELHPEMLIGECYDPSEIAGGTPAENAVLTLAVLRGENRAAPRAAVVLNAAAACYVSGLAPSLEKAIPLAENAIDSGLALNKLRILVEESRR